ncbi:hypothetical protein HDU96_007276, partial [Phlyctochytrium bullatum]
MDPPPRLHSTRPRVMGQHRASFSNTTDATWDDVDLTRQSVDHPTITTHGISITSSSSDSSDTPSSASSTSSSKNPFSSGISVVPSNPSPAVTPTPLPRGISITAAKSDTSATPAPPGDPSPPTA